MGNSNGKPVVLTDEVNLNHFRLLRVVGKGAFGKVRIVERKDTGLTFALKYIRKDEVVRSESVRNIIRERRMLEHLNHPFLCNLRYSFQDMEYLYIVVDLMNGGDLRFHISRKTFTEEAVRFWIAELGCALRYIHKQGIVHRDVKPDNILLDSEGHVHLADFNVASDFTPNKALTSKSGTLAYLAPEVYAGKGYLSEVDWWSLGVVFYECIYNKRPFEANSHEALAQAVLKAEVPYPATAPAVSMPCLHAISSLLEKNKAFRIGAGGFSTFTDNPFFRDIDFEALERKELDPVFCPSSDKTNFDATYDLEELLLEEAPLEARARKQKPRAELREDATKQEIRAEELHRLIETMFEPFNYTALPQERSPVATSASPTHTAISPASTSQAAVNEKSKSAEPSPNRPPVMEHERSIPTPRSQTPGNLSQTRSSTRSPEGSPPFASAKLAAEFYPPPTSHPDSAIQTSKSKSPSTDKQEPKELGRAKTARGYNDMSSVPASLSAGPPQRPRGAARSKSIGGSASIILKPQPGWADIATQGPSSPPPTAGEMRHMDRPSGMLGFLSRKRGRDRSPKGKERERGVLGKEGARVILSHG